ncbi:hypothetical protein MNBD_ACTINO02-1742 [hydrothermal vent metagenome]|uniref:Uncharacterized protein n=1 Tax=hydrothermal vent metagenome TaxID=652676 RepID=A0A3B0SR19_9ZZZZ
MKKSKLVAATAAFALIVAACTSTSVEPSTSRTPETSTTTPAVSTTQDPGTGSTSTADASDPDPAIVAALKAEIDPLIDITEELRGIQFLRRPEVVVISTAQMAARVRDDIEEEIDLEDIAITDRMFRLLGMMGPDDALAEIYPELYAEQVAGFYDGDTQELVVAADTAELSALTKSVVVHELVHALTDQYFEFHDTMTDLADAEGRSEEVAALQALAEGDATYFQFLYLQQLPLLEQAAMLVEAQDVPTDVLDSAPSFLAESLGFPYTTGFVFVQSLMDLGGAAALDRAYESLPVTTEQIMHPDRYRSGEGPRTVAPPKVVLDGWQLQVADTFGEWGLNLLFLDSVSRGDRVVATNGWGGDSYSVYYNADDVAFVMRYVGDSEEDAVEVAQALIDHTEGTLGLGDGVTDGGGRLWDTGDTYAFVDRIGDGLVYIISSDPAAGRSIRAQVSVP